MLQLVVGQSQNSGLGIPPNSGHSRALAVQSGRWRVEKVAGPEFCKRVNLRDVSTLSGPLNHFPATCVLFVGSMPNWKVLVY